MATTDTTPLVVCLVLFVVACIALAATAAILYRRYNALLKLSTEQGSVHADAHTVAAISPSASSASTPQRDNSPAALLHRRMNSRSSDGGLSVSILEAHGSDASDMSGGGSPRTPSFGSEYSDSSPTTRSRSAGSIFQRESAMRKDLGAMLEQATADIAALQEVGAGDGGASSGSKRSNSAESRSGGRGRADSLGSLSTTLGKCLALFSEADSWDSDQQMEKRILTRRVSDNALNAQ